MRVKTSSAPEISERFLPAEKRQFYERAASAVGLGIIALLSYKLERNDLGYGLPTGLRAALTSCAHPVLGYIGGWMGLEAAGVARVQRVREEAAIVAATAANFVTEQMQDALSGPIADTVHWYNNPPETFKDYAAAMAGAALFIAQTRHLDSPECLI